MIGKKAVAAFMFVFPVIVKQEHFAMMRQHIVATTGSTSFEAAWYAMQQQFRSWGQFVIMGNYLFHFHHDAYAWDIAKLRHLSTVEKPKPILAHHFPNNFDVALSAERYFQQICLQSLNLVANCKNYPRTDAQLIAARTTMFTDYWPVLSNNVVWDIPAHKMGPAMKHLTAPESEIEELVSHSIEEVRGRWEKLSYDIHVDNRSVCTLLK